MTQNNGGPAFPVECEWINYGKGGVRGKQTGETTAWETGMSLRDYFAAAAPIAYMDALIECGFPRKGLTDPQRAVVMSVMAMMRYEYADAMLKAREG